MSQFRDSPAPEELHDVNVHDVALDGDGGRYGRSEGDLGEGASAAYTSKKWYKKPVFWAAGGCVVVIVVVVLIVVFATGGSRSKAVVGVTLPPVEVSPSELAQNLNELASILVARYQSNGMDTTPLANPSSFQGRALEYVAGAQSYKDWTNEQNVERFAVVVFYLSTYRQPHILNASPQTWLNQYNWLTNNRLCLWEGIECNGDQLVIGLVLTNNRLSGTIPLELSLVRNLGTLDLSSNMIYMDEDHHGVWKFLPNLTELTMDDNFFISETGIPREFSGLKSITKISLSFNLLQGVFDSDSFAALTNLVHFEAESNYIGGPIPASLTKLTGLTYLYLRRNSLVFPLSDVLQAGNLPSLFALWLDSNTVTGNIPTAIGNFTSIASFSITDAQLKGPIPTEMGLLTDLQRVWLYGNQLTGPIPAAAALAWTKLEVFEVYNNNLIGAMPTSICTSIQASTYSLKSLIADCKEVSCTNCCTECY